MRKKVYVKQIGVPVSDKMYEKLVNLCDKQELSVSQWVRSAIETKLAQEHANKSNQPTTKE